MKKFVTVFLQGLMAVLPLAVTAYILYWLATSTESLIGGMLRAVLPERWYVPGMGIAAGLLIILGIGILLRIWLVRKVFELTERILEKMPLIKSLYGSIRDLMSFFDTSKKKDFDKVVMVAIPGQNLRLMGLVTRENFHELADGIGDENTVAVYLPMSYQLGGYTIFISRDHVSPVDLSIEQAMRFVLTAGVSTQKQNLAE